MCAGDCVCTFECFQFSDTRIFASIASIHSETAHVVCVGKIFHLQAQIKNLKTTTFKMRLIYMYMYVCMYTYVCMYVCMYIYIIYIYMCVYIM
jgi:hypothetical protein